MNNFFNLFFLIVFLPVNLFALKNQEFIDKKLKNIEKAIENGKFVDAQLFIGKDTINNQILQFDQRDSKLAHFLCIEKAKDTKYKFHYAKDIIGFHVLNDLYVKIYWREESIFIKRIAYGNINLYEKQPIPSDPRYLYFLQENDTYNLHVINPEATDVYAMGTNTKNENSFNMVISEVVGLHDGFVNLVKATMGDCEMVKTMVKTGNYLRDDLIDLVNTYNECFE